MANVHACASNVEIPMKNRCLIPNLCSAVGLLLSSAVFAQASAPVAAPLVAVDCRPNYPMEAVRANAQGVTVLVFHVNVQGKPTGGEVLRKSGPSLDMRGISMSDAINSDPPDAQAYVPTAEEIRRMRAASNEELAAVDQMILRECSPRFQKVAKIVGLLFEEFGRRYEHLPYALLQARMENLEDFGLVEIIGDVWLMGQSEIRLVPGRVG